MFCYAEKNPETASDAFKYSNINNATLHVPATSFDAYNVEPWKSFGTIVGLDGNKCAMPTISYNNGELTFECETEGAVCLSTITDSDIKSYSDNKVKLSVTYTITVYATKAGYADSDVATATLCWVDVEPVAVGIDKNMASVRALPVLIQGRGGVLTVEGASEGTPISVYDTAGRKVGSATASAGVTTISTTLPCGAVGIVNVGDKAVKLMMR